MQTLRAMNIFHTFQNLPCRDWSDGKGRIRCLKSHFRISVAIE